MSPGLCLLASLFVSAPTEKSDVLPLTKLRLYETGVGYFERRGGVKPGSGLALPLPASHIDDALKTLVILDTSGDTHVQGVKFASAVTETGARAMAGLPDYADDPVGYVDVLASLEGSTVEIRRGTKKTEGTLLDIEGPFDPIIAPGTTAGTKEPWHAVVMIDDDGGVHRIRTDAIDSVRAIESGTQERLSVAAQALADQGARRAHPLGVDVSSTGQLALGYISESPVWRTTYRVVLGNTEKAELQAWALVHNDTDEDWSKVQLELANGRPQSFLYPLAAPRYAYRELTGPEEDLSAVPQLANATADRMWDDEGGLGLVGTGRGGGGTGEGTIGLGSVGLIGHGGGGGMGGPSLGDLAELSQAEGEESGSLFIYRVVDPLDLDAHHSALVPIVQQNVEAESITWFSRGDYDAYTGARLVNSTTQTLPSGVVSFFADGGFVGESALRRLKPKERQFVLFGSEQDVDLDRDQDVVADRIVDVRSENGKAEASRVVETEHTLTVHNRSGRARTVYVALDVPRNARIDAEVELDFDLDTSSPLVRIEVPAGTEVSETVKVETGQVQGFDVEDEKFLVELRDDEGIPKAKRDTIADVLKHRRARLDAAQNVTGLRAKLKRKTEELERLRTDLDALGRVRMRGRVAKKLAKKLLETEHRVEDLRDEIKDARDEMARERRQAEFALERL